MVSSVLHTCSRQKYVMTLTGMQEIALLQYLLSSKRWAAGFISCLHTSRGTFALQASISRGPLLAYSVRNVCGFAKSAWQQLSQADKNAAG